MTPALTGFSDKTQFLLLNATQNETELSRLKFSSKTNTNVIIVSAPRTLSSMTSYKPNELLAECFGKHYGHNTKTTKQSHHFRPTSKNWKPNLKTCAPHECPNVGRLVPMDHTVGALNVFAGLKETTDVKETSTDANTKNAVLAPRAATTSRL